MRVSGIGNYALRYCRNTAETNANDALRPSGLRYRDFVAMAGADVSVTGSQMQLVYHWQLLLTRSPLALDGRLFRGAPS